MVSPTLQLALRRERGKQLLPRFLEDLSCLLNRPTEPIDLVELDETDKLWTGFETELQSRTRGEKEAFRRTWPASEYEAVQRVIAKLKARVPDHPMFLLRALSEYCGAVRTSAREILENAFRLTSLDQDDLRATSKDLSSGILLGFDTDWLPTGPAETYELVVWGTDWLAALADEQSIGSSSRGGNSPGT